MQNILQETTFGKKSGLEKVKVIFFLWSFCKSYIKTKISLKLVYD